MSQDMRELIIHTLKGPDTKRSGIMIVIKD